MAIRTGTQIKSDIATAETAVDTLITTPTIVNRDAAVTALDTVIANSKQSRLIQSSDASARRIHADFVENADALRHEILNSSQHHATASQPVGPASVFRSIKRTHIGTHGPWVAYKTTPTVD
jgi:hypothetical protein